MESLKAILPQARISRFAYRMSFVIITGGIGTGKSTVLAAFAKLGAHCLDADEVAHELYTPAGPAWKSIVNHFGDAVLLEDGTLNRAAIAARVFREPKELSWLNGLLHPLIRERMLEEATRIEPSPLFVAVPLWYEVGWQMPDVKVIATWCSAEQQMERLRKRGWDDAEIERRLRQQLSRDEKLNRADFGILTIGSLELLQEQCRRVYLQLTNKITD